MRRFRSDSFAVLWTVLVLLLIYMPIVSVVLASLANTRYMRFPHRVWSVEPYREAFGLYTTWELPRSPSRSRPLSRLSPC
jgi:spermidine/putrescine transport system permease protein